MSRLEHLTLPEPEHDIALLMPRRRDKKRSEQAGRRIVTGFETPYRARKENALRLLSAKVVLQKERKRKAKAERLAALEELVSILSGCGNPVRVNRACMVSMRGFRRRFVGALLKLVRECGLPAKAFTLLSRGWILTEDELTSDRLRKILQQFDNHLKRLKIPKGRGFVIAGLDAERDKTTGRYFVHLHGIVAGDLIDAFDTRLRRRRAYKRCKEIKAPLKLYDLTHLPRQLSYIAKPMWFQGCYKYEEDGNLVSRSKYAKRIDEPHHAHYLSVLASLSVGETIVLHRVRATQSGLSLT